MRMRMSQLTWIEALDGAVEPMKLTMLTMLTMLTVLISTDAIGRPHLYLNVAYRNFRFIDQIDFVQFSLFFLFVVR